jgi:hypothetical protein
MAALTPKNRTLKQQTEEALAFAEPIALGDSFAATLSAEERRFSVMCLLGVAEGGPLPSEETLAFFTEVALVEAIGFAVPNFAPAGRQVAVGILARFAARKARA